VTALAVCRSQSLIGFGASHQARLVTASLRQEAGARLEVALRILGVEPGLDRRPARLRRNRDGEAGEAYGITAPLLLGADGKKIGRRDAVRALYCIVRYSRLGDRLRRAG